MVGFLQLDPLSSGARELGVELSDTALEQLDEFARLLVERNHSLNLTRITDPGDIVVNHYLDSLTCLAAAEFQSGARVMDVGTGAGFPGIPIAAARPDLHVVLMDATCKKLAFVEEAAAKIGLANVEILPARAEEIGRDPAHRERYDVVITRALSEMRVLVELCLPLVRVGGLLIAQKGVGIEEEVKAALPMIGQLGGRLNTMECITLPHSDARRAVVVITKIKPTPAAFPRAYARIVRNKKVGGRSSR